MVKANRPSAAAEPVAPKPRKGKVKTVEVAPWPVIYPEVDCNVMLGDDALTAETAWVLMGCTYDKELAARKGCLDPLLKDESGREVYAIMNAHNRPFDEKTARKYAQDILNRHWADGRTDKTVVLPVKLSDDSDETEDREFPETTFNGETIVIGRTGRVLSGQHRLMGLILAAQIWAGWVGLDKDGKVKTRPQPRWKSLWAEEPTIECFLAVGISEDRKTVRTLDAVRQRTVGDVLYTREDLFPALSPSSRTSMARVLGVAIRFLWERTGMKDDPWNASLTNAEAEDFIDRHPGLAEAVAHIVQEYKKDSSVLRQRFMVGPAAGLMYLMGVSGTDGERDGRNRLNVYWKATPPSEAVLDKKHWKKSLDFWTKLCSNKDRNLIQVDHVFAALRNDEGKPASVSEKTAVLSLAWDKFLAGENITPSKITPKTETNHETGRRSLTEVYSVGGIDAGNKVGKRSDQAPPIKDGGEDDGSDGESGEDVDSVLPGSADDEDYDEDEDREDEHPDEFPDEDEPDEDEIASQVEEAKERVARDNGRQPPPSSSPGDDLRQEMDDLRAEYPGRLIVVRMGEVSRCWGEDAVRAAKAVPGTRLKKHPTFGIDFVDITTANLRRHVEAMKACGYRPLSVEVRGGEKVVKEFGSGNATLDGAGGGGKEGGTTKEEGKDKAGTKPAPKDPKAQQALKPGKGKTPAGQPVKPKPKGPAPKPKVSPVKRK